MSMKGSPIGWWKEKRHRSYSGISAASGAIPTRPATALAVPKTRAAQEKEDHERSLQKLIEEAVLAAFNSDAFKDAVASQLDPATARQQEKLNQLKTTSLNLESTLQTRMDEFPAYLKPIEDHLTNLDIPHYENEMEDLAAGQGKLTTSIGSMDDRIKLLEESIETLDSTVMNSDLRSAIRFGEISNELQDQNTILSDRIWELERTLGKRVDAQQRRVVGACEELGRAIRSTQDKITSLEEAHASGLEKICSETDKITALVESTQKQISKDATTHNKALNTLETDTNSMKKGIQDVLKQLDSLDTTPLKSHTQTLESLSSNLSRIEERVNSLDTKPLLSHTERLGSMASILTKVDNHLSTLDTTPLATHTEKLDSLATNLTRVDKQLSVLDTTPLVSHTAKLEDLKGSILNAESSINDRLSTQENSLQDIQREISLPRDTSELEKILSEIQDNERASANRINSIRATLDSILDTTTSSRAELTLQSESISATNASLQQLGSESAASSKDITSCIISNLEASKSEIDRLNSTLDIHVASLMGLKGAELMSILKEVQDLNITNSTALDTLKQASASMQHALGEMHTSTISEIKHGAISISSGFENAATKESSREKEVRSLQTKLQEITETLERHGITLQAISTFKPIVELSHKVFASHDLLTESKAALSQNADIGADILSKSSSLQSTTEKLAQVVSLIDEKLKDELSSLSNAIEGNKLGIEEKISHALSTVSANTVAASESTDSALSKLTGDLDTLNSKLSAGLTSIADQAEGHKSAIEIVRCLVDNPKSVTDILEEVRSSRTVLDKAVSESEVLQGIQSVKEEINAASEKVAKEASSTKDLLCEIRHNQQDENILKSVNDISERQSSHGSTVLKSLQSIQENTMLSEIATGLNSVRLLLEDARTSYEGELLEGVKSVQSTIASTTKSIEDIKHDIQQSEEISSKILTDVANVKQVALKNETSSATICERTAELDTKIKMSQDALETAIQEMQTAINRDILDTTRSITNSVNDIAGGLEINIKDIDSRIATSTKVLRAEIKAIDLSPFDSLRTDVDSITKMASEATKQLSVIAEEIPASRSHIIAENTKSSTALSEALTSHVTSVTVKGNSEVLAAIGSLDITSKERDTQLQGSLKSMNTDVTATADNVQLILKDSLPKIAVDVGKLNPALGQMDKSIESINGSMQNLEETTKASDAVLSKIDGKVSTSAEVQSSITAIRDIRSTVDKMHLETLQTIQSNGVTISSVQDITRETSSNVATLIAEVPSTRKAIAEAENKSKTLLETVRSELTMAHSATKSLGSKVEEMHIPSILHAVEDNRLAIEANREILVGVATTSSVKSISAAICRVDKTVLETGAQVKGVIYEGNKKVINEIDSVLSQLDESINQNEIRIQGISEFEIPRLEWQLARNYDALHIIGARVIGTSKRFEEAIRENSGGHPGKGNHQLLGRLRSESNARSNASSGKDSGGTRS